jgi:hypothetical protein
LLRGGEVGCGFGRVEHEEGLAEDVRYTTSPARYYPSDIWACLALEWVCPPYVLFHSVKMSHRLVRIRRAFLMRDRPVGPLRGPMNIVQADGDGCGKRLLWKALPGASDVLDDDEDQDGNRESRGERRVIQGMMLECECKKAAMRE